MFNQYRVIHFVGIGGIGMSGIAEVLNNLGYEVTGSDIKGSSTIERLLTLGIKVYIGHRPENIDSAHVVVVSSAIGKENVEVTEARRRSIPVIPRAEMLAELGRLKYSVLVAGSHGKTTTTSLISTILLDAGYDPTVVIGGKLMATNSNANLGRGQFMVAEADESDGSFLKLSPTIAVCTNIDKEHMDYFSDMENLKKAFLCFLNKVPFYGLSVVSADDPNVRDILPHINRKVVTYGLSHPADYTVKNITFNAMTTQYDLFFQGELLERFEVPLTGKHNILNTLAATATALYLKIDIESVIGSLQRFKGIKRRLEFKGESMGVKVYDDYGHHPTEIQMTIQGVRQQTGNRLLVVFQPHRYTRTQALMEEFAHSFTHTDRLYLLDIYPAGEDPIEGINSQTLYQRLRSEGVEVAYFSDTQELLSTLSRETRRDDYLLTFGAGDVWKVGEDFIRGSYASN
ncbi:UDP-N-acetylmuramate--L-alanine ligase [Candidatus Magnetobacterium casense]|uniref:UDP-N-acetylmuramate--L-alanine ligase n=1 Tax=Candidatus Magnetobacterium casense TaxID=1455061 RepID=A0ABS6RVW7_9BACT|nr:UDP-N-acetylmuramate--L-alanine ligase [Candidatus Magnetobacterium casensis]MBV6340774.1 UDP-N-acetylmuramate--L-alanine ligase [Candidatus Magnetobacterium casensis]